MLKSRTSTFALHRLDENVRGGVSMHCDAGKVPMKAPKITRRLVAIGVIASVIVALTASLASAAPIMRPMVRPMIAVKPGCVGNATIKLRLLDATGGLTTGIPFPGGTYVYARHPDNFTMFLFGKTDNNGYGQFTFSVEPFCSAGGNVDITLWWRDDEGYFYQFATAELGPFPPFGSGSRTVDLGTRLVTDPD